MEKIIFNLGKKKVYGGADAQINTWPVRPCSTQCRFLTKNQVVQKKFTKKGSIFFL